MRWECKQASGSDHFFQDVEFELGGEKFVHKTTITIYNKQIIVYSELLRRNNNPNLVSFTILGSNHDMYTCEKGEKE